MSKNEKTLAALKKFATVAAVVFAFLIGLGAMLVLSLRGSEVSVPAIVGRNFEESEGVLGDLGLRIKKRAERYSEEAPGTVLEQLPKAGETVKTGQMILVVVSKANPEGSEKPATLNSGEQSDDSKKIEELISERPKKKEQPNSNANTASPEPTPEIDPAKPASEESGVSEKEPKQETKKTSTDTKGATPKPSATPQPKGRGEQKKP
mgnify:CR=1 FL=1